MDLLMALRPQQWIKNLILFAPLVFALELFNQDLATTSLYAFCVFCGLSSGGYLYNDICDLKADRVHEQKKNRPIAAGRVATSTASLTMIILTGVSLLGAFLISLPFFTTAVLYIALSIGYSSWLKQIVLLDILTVATGFVLRAYAGALAIQVEFSDWLLVVTLFLFLFLIIGKRKYEMTSLGEKAFKHREVLLQYSANLTDQLLIVTATACLMGYTLYTLWPSTVERFGTSDLVFTVPIVVYGMFRFLLITNKEDLTGDPTNVLLTDRYLLASAVLWLMAVVAIIYQ